MVSEIAQDAVKRWTEWIELVSKIVVLIGGILAAFWAYIRFVLERGLLPPVEFDLTCTPAGVVGVRRVIEVVLRLKNVGTSTLICSNLRLDVKYFDSKYLRTGCDDDLVARDPRDPRFGSVVFPRSLLKHDLGLTSTIERPTKSHAQVRPWVKNISYPLTLVVKLIGRATSRIRSLFYIESPKTLDVHHERGFPVLRYDTFVQPGICQTYTVATALPETATHVLIWASFQYGTHPSPLQRAALTFGRISGLIQYSLSHVNMPHTTQRVFAISTATERK